MVHVSLIGWLCIDRSRMFKVSNEQNGATGKSGDMTILDGKKNSSETDAKKQRTGLFAEPVARSSRAVLSTAFNVVLVSVLIGFGVFFVQSKQKQKEPTIVRPDTVSLMVVPATEQQVLPTPFDEEASEDIEVDDDVVAGEAIIFIASIPPVADVYLGDRLIGKTNVSQLTFPSGVHTLRFVKGAKVVIKELTLKPGKNPSVMVRIP